MLRLFQFPKWETFSHATNWHGIRLLDVVEKIFARIIQERLQIIAETILPQSQCGFRKVRGCVDMIFVARQLVEKTYELILISCFFCLLSKRRHTTQSLLLFGELDKEKTMPWD